LIVRNVKIRAMSDRLFSLRQLRQLSRIVLMLYVLTLGVAIASPVINPQAMAIVCTSTGIKLVDINTGKTQTESGKGSASMAHLLDCPMCLATSLPASMFNTTSVEPPHLLSYVLQAIPAARLASITAAPLPARGPPDLS
jgi:Protein of unknown function (DUF2946)